MAVCVEAPPPVPFAAIRRKVCVRTRLAAPFAILSLAALAACTEWSAQPIPPGPQPAVIEGRVRVTRTDGQRLELAAAEVRGDSLYGTRVDVAPFTPLILPLAEVARVESQETNTTLPALFVLVTIVAAFRWIVLPGLITD